jgi:hypothetical protein
LVVAKTKIGPRKILSRASKFELESDSDAQINRDGIIKGKATTAIIGALLPRIESDPQKQQIRLIKKLARIAFQTNPGWIIDKIIMIGAAQTSQFAKTFALTKTS